MSKRKQLRKLRNKRRSQNRIVEICEIGMPRTGTRSLSEAMGILGYSVNHGLGFVKKRSVEESKKLHSDFIRDLLWGHPPSIIYDNYQFVGNLPIIHWQTLAEENSSIRFILTDRSEQEWWKSCYTRWQRVRRWRVRGICRSRELQYRQIFSFIFSLKAFGCYGMNETAWRAGFRSHRESVIRYFEGTDRLLIHNTFEGDGYSSLCSFLGRAVPDSEYPNTTSVRTSSFIEKDLTA